MMSSSAEDITLESGLAPNGLRIAALTLDIEDWWHLEYLQTRNFAPGLTLLDGVNRFLDCLGEFRIPATIFVLSELLPKAKSILREAQERGHSVECHGNDHKRPMKMSVDQFRTDLGDAKKAIEDVIGAPVEGYRAPCYSLDRTRLDIARDLGFKYDSSKIRFELHPLYEALDLSGFDEVAPGIWREGDFFEFELTTVRRLGRTIPVSGGGYLRLFPWGMTKRLIGPIATKGFPYTFYSHPFEMSGQRRPFSIRSAGLSSWIRFSIGRSTFSRKLQRLIAYLSGNGYRFLSLSQLRGEMMSDDRSMKKS
jgi:peptidoglycan/xylan/chitin deacetylase (PgdA/CDA1 family)